MKRTLSVTAVAAALLLAPLAVADAAPAGDTYFQNCKEVFAAGQANIKQGEPGYRAPLDRDKDGVACEKGDPAAMNNGMGPRDEEAASGTSDGQDSSDGSATDESTDDSGTSDESTSDDGTSDDATDDSSDDSDQVGLVPEGGAPSGDGSTETGFGWWIGGGLLMAMAGAGLALRQRVFGRS